VARPSVLLDLSLFTSCAESILVAALQRCGAAIPFLAAADFSRLWSFWTFLCERKTTGHGPRAWPCVTKNKISDVSIWKCAKWVGPGHARLGEAIYELRGADGSRLHGRKPSVKPLKLREACGGFSSRFVGQRPIQTGKNACPTWAENQMLTTGHLVIPADSWVLLW
jgi:hypothetical protein